jgi:hypothetical protein
VCGPVAVCCVTEAMLCTVVLVVGQLLRREG